MTVTSGPGTVTVTCGAQVLPMALTRFLPPSEFSTEPVSAMVETGYTVTIAVDVMKSYFVVVGPTGDSGALGVPVAPSSLVDAWVAYMV